MLSKEVWYYPSDFEKDLQGVGLPNHIIAELLGTAWEYSRVVIPHFTNWKRYVGFTRLTVLAMVADFRGALVDVAADNKILGYDVDNILDDAFGGTVGHEPMAREYRAFLLFAAEKSSNRRNSEMFRLYVNALAQSPRQWFRLRSCDTLGRLAMVAALACNDFDDMWFTEEEFEILEELAVTLYDATTFYKHRAEGETHNTFAYARGESVGDSSQGEFRKECYRRCREILWALDLAWTHDPARRCVVNCAKVGGTSLAMMVRRYRFVEDGLTIGNPETESIVEDCKKNTKFWYRVDTKPAAIDREVHTAGELGSTRFKNIIAQSSKLLIPGLAEILESSDDGHCDQCHYRPSYGAEIPPGRFGGVELCDSCSDQWRTYLETLPARTVEVFPALKGKLCLPAPEV